MTPQHIQNDNSQVELVYFRSLGKKIEKGALKQLAQWRIVSRVFALQGSILALVYPIIHQH